MYIKKILSLVLIIVMSLQLTACGPLLVASAAGTFAVVADRRTTGTVIEDNAIELKAFKKLNSDTEISNNSNISISSYNERILITGQAKNNRVKEKVIDAIRSIPKVRTIYDEVTIGEESTFTSSSYDTWLTTKVKTSLTGDSRVNPLYIKVKTVNKVVYLMGFVDKQEANAATDIVRKVSGVNKVVKLFEYMDVDSNSNNQYARN